MPYNYAHALVGITAQKSCANGAQVLLDANEGAFLLGTMGPDPYYGSALLPTVGGKWCGGLADRLHAMDGRALFGALLALASQSDADFAYALGFICHFLLDNLAHPYIEARFPGRLHTPAEIAIDPLILAHAGERRLVAAPRALYDASLAQRVDALHAALFWKRFALRTDGDYARALPRWLWIANLQYDPRGRKRALFRPFPAVTRHLTTFGAPDTEDLLNLAHTPWGKGRTESFPELTARAAGEAAQWMELAVAGRRDGAYEPLLRLAEGRTADAAKEL